MGHAVKIKHMNISYAKKKLRENFPIYGTCIYTLSNDSLFLFPCHTTWAWVALFPGPAQLSVACSTKPRSQALLEREYVSCGEPGIFST